MPMRIVLVLVAAALLAAGCGSSSSSGSEGTSVVAAFYPLAYAADQIGKDVQVENLTPPGTEPHDIELTPKETAEIQQADVVIYLSHGFQPAVEQAVQNAEGTTLDALDGIELRNGVGDEAGEADPHVWLDPVLFAGVVKRIGDVLDQPAAAFVQRLNVLDGQFRRGLAQCKQRTFVTSHAAFAYLAQRYGLHMLAITGVDPESEPSPKAVANLAKLVEEKHITTVFFETLVSPKLAQTVAREAGAKTAVLDPIEGLTDSETKAGASYFSVMRQNLANLRAALGCT
jgi:zinc transport system substrate-binding protein